MGSIKIKTSQNVEVEYPMASVGDRIVAHLIDLAVFIAWFMFVAMVAGAVGGTESVFFLVFLGLPLPFYHLVCEIFFNGQSVGKMGRDIKVIKLSGEAPGIGDYLLRWMFRLIDTVLSQGIVAVVTIVASRHGQRFGDMAAGTCVIKTKPVTNKDRIQVRIEEDYQIRFPEVSVLTDHDMALIRKLLYKAKEHGNYALLEKIGLRVKDSTGIQTDMGDWDFLQTVVKDYYHLTHADLTGY